MGFVARLAAQLTRGAAELAQQGGGKSALGGVADPRGDISHRQVAAQQQFAAQLQAVAAYVVHGRLPGFGQKARMEACRRQAAQARQVGDLKRMGAVARDVSVDQGQGQASLGRGLAAAEAGQKQGGALLGDHFVVDRAGSQPVDQLALGWIEQHPTRSFEQALAGIGMDAQALLQPSACGYVENQAVAARRAGAGVMGAGRHHGEAVAEHLAALAGHLEIQAAGQAEHQLGVCVAVGNLFVAVLAQGEDRVHGRLLNLAGSLHRRDVLAAVIELPPNCHGAFIAVTQARGNPSRKPPMTSAQLARPTRKQRVRTLWVSDVHLGTRDCQAEHLAAFLKRYHADKVYLVGDIIDGWKLRSGIYWPQAHTNVLRRLLTMSKRGTEVIYVTGNHDEFLRRYSSLILGNIQLVDEAEHVTADGRRLLVVHGDQFDVITRYHRWLAFLGDSAYEFTLTLNRWLNHWRGRYGYGYWSLSAYLKHKVKSAVNFISDFEEAIVHECAKRGFNGVICGHIHHAEIRQMGEVEYLNCGDWVESCTALIEHWDGRIELYRLAEDQARQASLAQAEATSAEPVV